MCSEKACSRGERTATKDAVVGSISTIGHGTPIKDSHSSIFSAEQGASEPNPRTE